MNDIKCEQIATLYGKFEKMFQQSRRVYGIDGLSPSIHTCGGGNTEIKIGYEDKKDLKIARCVGGIGEKKSNGGTQYYQQDRIYAGDIALAHPANLPGGSYKYLVDEPIIYDDYNNRVKADQSVIGTVMPNFGNDAPRNGTKIIECTAVAIRGRGENNKQQIEMSDREYANSITTVQKDSMVAESIIEDFYKNRPEREYKETCPTIRNGRIGLKVKEILENTKGIDNIDNCNCSFRIRKLTPKECWRLMGQSDENFAKAESVCSNSQLYKQAGNSIVVNVLERIFANLLIK